ncbi:hypothetical protein [Halobaculum sp. EA56]|uniref:hypothetical protein n=1 Tax=Halobaculum sp. EA56 TaxID=3421648 RepID=UPI003EBEDD36
MVLGFLGRWVFVFGIGLVLHLGVLWLNLRGGEVLGLGSTVGLYGILAVGGGGWLAAIAGVWSWLSGRGHLLAFTLLSFGAFLLLGAVGLYVWFGCVIGCPA